MKDRTHSRLKETEESWQLNAAYDPVLNPGPGRKREHSWDSWQNLNRDCGLGGSVTSTLSLWFGGLNSGYI